MAQRRDLAGLWAALSTYTPDVQPVHTGNLQPYHIDGRFCFGGWAARQTVETIPDYTFEAPNILEEVYGLNVLDRSKLYDASDYAKDPEDRIDRIIAVLDRWEAEEVAAK